MLGWKTQRVLIWGELGSLASFAWCHQSICFKVRGYFNFLTAALVGNLPIVSSMKLTQSHPSEASKTSAHALGIVDCCSAF